MDHLTACAATAVKELGKLVAGGLAGDAQKLMRTGAGIWSCVCVCVCVCVIVFVTVRMWCVDKRCCEPITYSPKKPRTRT